MFSKIYRKRWVYSKSTNYKVVTDKSYDYDNLTKANKNNFNLFESIAYSIKTCLNQVNQHSKLYFTFGVYLGDEKQINKTNHNNSILIEKAEKVYNFYLLDPNGKIIPYVIKKIEHIVNNLKSKYGKNTQNTEFYGITMK